MNAHPKKSWTLSKEVTEAVQRLTDEGRVSGLDEVVQIALGVLLEEPDPETPSDCGSRSSLCSKSWNATRRERLRWSRSSRNCAPITRSVLPTVEFSPEARADLVGIHDYILARGGGARASRHEGPYRTAMPDPCGLAACRGGS